MSIRENNLHWPELLHQASESLDGHAIDLISDRIVVSDYEIRFDQKSFIWTKTAGGGIRLSSEFYQFAKDSGFMGKALDVIKNIALNKIRNTPRGKAEFNLSGKVIDFKNGLLYQQTETQSSEYKIHPVCMFANELPKINDVIEIKYENARIYWRYAVNYNEVTL